MTLPPVRQLAVAAALLLATACTQAAPSPRVAAPAEASADGLGAPVSRGVIEVHRSRTCQCCHRHEEHLRRAGFEVVTVFEDDIAAYKTAGGIPSQLYSCHTSQVAGYFVEGHVPAEAIIDLLETRPEIDGIALPAMPSLAPGMAPDGGSDSRSDGDDLLVSSADGGEIETFGRY